MYQYHYFYQKVIKIQFINIIIHTQLIILHLLHRIFCGIIFIVFGIPPKVFNKYCELYKFQPPFHSLTISIIYIIGILRIFISYNNTIVEYSINVKITLIIFAGVLLNDTFIILK